MRFMLSLIKDGITTQVVIENGKKRRVEVVASLEMRADLAKYVSRFIFPVLSASQVTGADDGPIEVETVTLGLDRIMADPALVEMAQTLSLAMSEASMSQAREPARLCAPSDESAAQPARDPMETLERDPQTGHWRK